jgi:hypothetical protein
MISNRSLADFTSAPGVDVAKGHLFAAELSCSGQEGGDFFLATGGDFLVATDTYG